MAALPFAVHAAGLGKISVLSALGQPLKAEIEVFSTSDEAQSIQTKLATADAFRQADIDYVPVLASLKFSSVKERDGRRYIQVTTDRPLNEPFVDMLVELNWTAGRLVREYTFLLDPPGLADATTATPAPVAAPVVRPEAAVAGSAQEPPSAAATEAPHGSPVPSAKKSSALTPVKGTGDAARKSYTVVAGDTLGKIATRNLPTGVSLDQMLVALFRNNQQAFSGSNMNRLRAGKILMIPDSEAVNSIAANEARKEVIAQAADFNAYRKKLAALAASEAVEQETTRQTSSGRISPKVQEATPASSGKDKLEVSRTEVARDGKLHGRVAALEEDLVARDKALKEANERAAELEKKLASMKKLVEMKSQAGSDLQQNVQAAKPAAASPSAPAAAVAESAAPDVANPSLEAKPAEVAKPVEAAPPPPVVKPKKKIIPPPPEPEPGFMEENGNLVFGGGGILALLLGWLGFNAWKRRKAGVEDLADAEPDFLVHSGVSAPSSASSVAPPLSEQQVSRFSEGFSQAAVAIDVLTEADTFLAFGRDAQAEEVLLAALETEPDRYAIYLKLLDIYAARKNLAAFGSLARRLHEKTGGLGADWERAAAMGAALDPGNSLYQVAALMAEPASEPPVAAPDFDATMVMQESPLATAVPGQTVEPAIAEQTEMVDFELDFEPQAAGGVEAAEAAPGTHGLDFDLDLGTAEDVATTAPATPIQAVDAPAPQDLHLGNGGAALPVIKASEPDSNSIDFDFDLLLDAGDKAEAAAPTLDLGGIDLNLDAPGASDAVSPEPIFDVTGGADAAENPEVATKLELAAAYEEMGDREGARELYQEALVEGNAAQQEAARSKLASLG
ncbi:MAG: FimV/HubP family polar landmark protein [Rugosibacter sp.]